MSQPRHNSHGYNPVTLNATKQGAILLAFDVNTDANNQYSRYDLYSYVSRRPKFF